MATVASRRTILQAGVAGGAVLTAPLGVEQVSRAESSAGVATTVVPSVCEMCTVRCPILVRVEDGAVVRIEGNPAEKGTQGAICARGNAGISLLEDPQRVRTPLIRVGDRGAAKFREATWEEAYAYIAERLTAIRDQHGPQALGVARRPSAGDPFLLTFAKAFGTPNIFSHESTCPLARNVAMEVTYGTAGLAVDYGKVDYLISFGRNHLETIAVPQAQGVVGALARGATVVYLDPRYTPTAAAATTWLQPVPGSDLAFVLGLLNVIIEERLYDAPFVARYTHGFDELAEFVRDHTPAWAAQRTGVSEQTIVEIARGFAKAAPRAVADPGWFTAGYLNEFQLRRAILALNAIVGNLEVPGGIYLLKKMKKHAAELGTWSKPPFPEPTAERVDGAGVEGRYPLVPTNDGLIQALPESVLTGKPYPLRAFIAHRFDPLAAVAGQDKMVEALLRLDLLVSVDVYVTDTGAYADVVLPECTYLERSDPVMEASGLVPKIRLRQQAVPPQGQARPASEIYQGLARAVGLGEYFAYRDIDEILAAQLAPVGLDPAELAKTGQWVPPEAEALYLRKDDPAAAVELSTPSGKIELVSEELAEHGYDPLLRYIEPPPVPEGAFRLVQGKCAVHTNSATANVPWLHELKGDNELWIHPDPAGRLGVADGDQVLVRAGERRQRGTARVTDKIRPDTVFAYHGWGRTSPGLARVVGKGISGNALVPVSTEPVSGSLVLRETFVEVSREERNGR